jgi:ribonuclease G
VVEISPLGLVEMTRQNVTDGPREILTRKCPTCAGEGVVVSETTAVVDDERKLRALVASKPRTKAFKVELNAHVADLLIGPGAVRLREIETATRRRFFVVGKSGVPHEHFAVLEEGTVEKLAPVDPPVAEGQTVELKLVEVARHDAGSAVGKLDGISVVVGGAGRLVGKKVSAHVERVLDGVAYATLADVAAGDPASAPITAEAQAEKPTRASRAKKPETPAVEAEADHEAEHEHEPVAEEADEQAEDVTATEPAPKKKTRRGSRGGRGRKKPAVATAAESNGQPETPPAQLPAPTIHVPSADVTEERGSADGGEPAAPKQKTRRGSRGGRGRRKKPAAPVDGAPAGVEIAEPTDAPQPATEPAATGKKQTRRGSRGGRRRRKPAAAPGEAVSTPADDAGSDQV